MRRAMSLLLIVLVAVASVVLLAWMFQRRLIYFPFGSVLAPSEAGLSSVERVEIPTSEGLTLGGWFVSSAASSTAFTVIVFNGNAGNRSDRAPLAAALRAHGIQVLLFDYRGFGGNDGTPTEAGLRADARAARAYVLGRSDVDASRLVYLGESLGSAVAIGLAAEYPPAALIVRSPFPSLVDVGRMHYPFLPVRWLLEDRFAAIDDIGRVVCPVLAIAGDQDRIIPVALSRRVYEATSAAKEFVIVQGADHNDRALLAGERMIAAIMEFLGRVG